MKPVTSPAATITRLPDTIPWYEVQYADGRPASHHPARWQANDAFAKANGVTRWQDAVAAEVAK